MGTFLQIIGGTCVTLLLLAVLAFFGLKFFLRSRFRKLMGGLGEVAQGSFTPESITLRLRESLDWQDEPAAKRYMDDLRLLGFTPAGLYLVPAIPGLKVAGFAKPADGFYAAIYEHPLAGVFADVVVIFEEGGATTVTTAPADNLDPRPDHLKVHLPGRPASDLVQELQTLRGDRTVTPTPPEDFAPVFERFYAEAMAWRNSRGGATPDEIRRIAAQSGFELNEEELEEMRRENERQASADLILTLNRKFLESGAVSAAEWDRIRDRVVIVHDRMHRDDVLDLLEGWTEEPPEEVPPSAANLPPRRLFESLNESLPPSERFRRLAELSEPVGADVYVAPEPV